MNKNKNLTFMKDFHMFCDLGSEIVIDITDENYIITRPTGENRAYLSGPAVDRLHAFEELGKEPKELDLLAKIESKAIDELRAENASLKSRLTDAEDTIITLNNNNECLKKELDKRIAKEQVDIHKLIDEVREKRDCCVHILIGDTYTSVDVRPDEPGLQRWILQEGHEDDANRGYKPRDIFVCPNCGQKTAFATLYCANCGEQLGEPKKMTCREKLKQEHPECVGDGYKGGCEGCPSHYGYASVPVSCLGMDCGKCWDREVEE